MSEAITMIASVSGDACIDGVRLKDLPSSKGEFVKAAFELLEKTPVPMGLPYMWSEQAREELCKMPKPERYAFAGAFIVLEIDRLKSL